MGIYLSDHDHDCLTNMRFADDVLLFATSKEQLRKTLCEFKKSTEKVGLRIHPEKTKILSNQSIINSDTKKELEIEDMKIEILTRNESVKYLGQKISFHPPGNDGNQESNQSCMGDIPQIQTRVDIEKQHAQSSSTAIRRRNISDYLLRSRNMDTQQRTRKNDSIDATQDVTTHYFRLKGYTKRSRNKKLGPTKKLKKQTCVALMMKAVTD